MDRSPPGIESDRLRDRLHGPLSYDQEAGLVAHLTGRDAEDVNPFIRALLKRLNVRPKQPPLAERGG